MHCSVFASAQEDEAFAGELAGRYSLNYTGIGQPTPAQRRPDESPSTRPASSWRFALEVKEQRINLVDTQSGKALIRDEPPKLYQVRRRDVLGRAVSGAGQRNRSGRNSSVIDATAGLGTDAIQLAMMQFSVVCIERSPVVALMLEARLMQLPKTIRQYVTLKRGDAIEQLDTLATHDVVYLDPMYPPKRRSSALPPLELQVLRQIVGPDNDATALFNKACQCAGQRVVVKRPIYAPPLAPPAPQGQHAGKLVRYDIYPQERL